MKKSTTPQLEQVLEKHKQWVMSGGDEGKKADLNLANLRMADLVKVDLSEANLSEADLSGADLREADLSRADLNGAYLSGACLSGAVLNGAYLSGAYISLANLRSADFSGADLGGANLIEADLSGAILDGANLRGIRLRSAILSKATLNGADLRESDLTEADLYGADLSKADFSRANLRGADLTESILHNSNFKQVRLYKTVFGFTDLSHVKNLVSCIHEGPSIIDHDTLCRSGRLPLSFLRGVGLPDRMIKVLPSKPSDKPIPYNTCFIGYSHEDESFARRIHADMQDRGIRCWLCPEDMKKRDHTTGTSHESQRGYDKLVLVLSKNMIHRSWVMREVETAFKLEERRKQRVLFPIRLDGSVTASDEEWAIKIRQTRVAGDFTDWKNPDSYRKAFQILMRILKRKVHR